MRILGLDVGEKKIGVAISDELGLKPKNRCNKKINDGKDMDIICEIVSKYELENNRASEKHEWDPRAASG